MFEMKVKDKVLLINLSISFCYLIVAIALACIGKEKINLLDLVGLTLASYPVFFWISNWTVKKKYNKFFLKE
ncbi:hypothetical protein [Pilibacter termitis]|nr:hypothetical protein [Pilibacter termitis]